MHFTTAEPLPLAARWAGDPAAVASRLLLLGELLCESVDLRAGERVLEVACGSGNAALAAARRCCRVTGIDNHPTLLERARDRARAEGLQVTFQEADPQDLPFADGAFDVVLSTGGAVLARGQEPTAGELLRVCRPGGRIGLVAWTHDGYVGELLAALGQRLPPPLGPESSLHWGHQERLRGLFRREVAVTAPRRSFLWRFPSAEHQVAFLSTFHTPTATALKALGLAAADTLRAELLELARRFDVAEDDTLALRLDYLEVVAHKPPWL